jgi:hypothetical protein
MVVTLHFISDNLEMTSVVIGFFRVLYPHTADRLAAAFFECTFNMHPDLLTSIWTITADNASTNVAMARDHNEQLQSHVLQLKQDANLVSAEDDTISLASAKTKAMLKISKKLRLFDVSHIRFKLL